MDLITQQWISGSVRRCTVGWGKRLTNMIESPSGKLRNLSYLGWYIVVKMPGVLRIVEFGSKWRGITINMGPVNSTKE
jgi:hypothetical protein